MFLGPLEASKPWSLQNVEGVYRFLKKIWREYIDLDGNICKKIQENGSDSNGFVRLLHETIAKVTEAIDNLRFNTASSQLMICMNGFQKETNISKASAKLFLQLLAPFAPHIAEELWERLGETNSIINAGWPIYDASKCISAELKIVVQVNGKVRDEILVSADATKDEIMDTAKKATKVIPYLEQGSLAKEIYVPGKLVNLVVK